MQAFISTFGEPQNPKNLQNPFMLSKSYQVPLFLKVTALPIGGGTPLVPLTAFLYSRCYMNCASHLHYALLTTHYALPSYRTLATGYFSLIPRFLNSRFFNILIQFQHMAHFFLLCLEVEFIFFGRSDFDGHPLRDGDAVFTDIV